MYPRTQCPDPSRISALIALSTFDSSVAAGRWKVAVPRRGQSSSFGLTALCEIRCRPAHTPTRSDGTESVATPVHMHTLHRSTEAAYKIIDKSISDEHR